MKISTKGRYGLRAVIDLAVNSDGRPVLLGDIAARQDLSRRYLERLFASLKSNGIIRSIRGAQGGYILAKEPHEINIAEILEALEGPFLPVDCVADHNICVQAEECVTRDVWCEIAIKVKEYLKSMTLQTLVEKYRLRQTTKTTDYQI